MQKANKFGTIGTPRQLATNLAVGNRLPASLAAGTWVLALISRWG